MCAPHSELPSGRRKERICVCVCVVVVVVGCSSVRIVGGSPETSAHAAPLKAAMQQPQDKSRQERVFSLCPLTTSVIRFAPNAVGAPVPADDGQPQQQGKSHLGGRQQADILPVPGASAPCRQPELRSPAATYGAPGAFFPLAPPVSPFHQKQKRPRSQVPLTPTSGHLVHCTHLHPVVSTSKTSSLDECSTTRPTDPRYAAADLPPHQTRMPQPPTFPCAAAGLPPNQHHTTQPPPPPPRGVESLLEQEAEEEQLHTILLRYCVGSQCDHYSNWKRLRVKKVLHSTRSGFFSFSPFPISIHLLSIFLSSFQFVLGRCRTA